MTDKDTDPLTETAASYIQKREGRRTLYGGRNGKNDTYLLCTIVQIQTDLGKPPKKVLFLVA